MLCSGIIVATSGLPAVFLLAQPLMVILIPSLREELLMLTHISAKGITSSIASLFLLISVLVLAAFTAAAQETTGSLRGTVVDPNGAVVAGANVTLTNTATGSSQTKQTSGDGNFAFDKLAPGDYTVAVEATGFKRSLSKGVS